ncbi:MAG: hypothetical protein D6763_09670 [Alphaproteobacteria bacterium]|nr:MAG: hypothetical protein D6763_09670 [Alphaproteobacteria bacterium]
MVFFRWPLRGHNTVFVPGQSSSKKNGFERLSAPILLIKRGGDQVSRILAGNADLPVTETGKFQQLIECAQQFAPPPVAGQKPVNGLARARLALSPVDDEQDVCGIDVERQTDPAAQGGRTRIGRGIVFKLGTRSQIHDGFRLPQRALHGRPISAVDVGLHRLVNLCSCLAGRPAAIVSAHVRAGATRAGAMDFDEQSWIFDAKLAPPAPLVSLVERPDLIGALECATEARLTLVVSPPGFGKTTLLTQWVDIVRSSGRTAGWVAMDEGDSDPMQLLACMILALARAGADMGELEKTAKQELAEVPLSAALAAFMVKMGQLSGPVVLILDDFHRGQSAELNAFMDLLLQRAPRNFHLVIASRERPTLTLTSLRAQGLVREIGPDAMKFSAAEARRIFGDMINDTEADRLVARTEGWAVALQLARLWLVDDTSRVEAIEQFSGRNADVADYLTEQVFSTLDPDLQDFLLDTSILERVSGDLANAVTGRGDCWELLVRLERLNVLLIPLDAERRWFRYHLLFRDFLEDQLQRRRPQRVAHLHRAASDWFAREGLVVEAARHAGLAGDNERVAEIIEDAGGWQLIIFGGVGRARSLLRNLPHDLLLDYPAIGLARVYLYVKDGDLRQAHALYEAIRTRTDDFKAVVRKADRVRRDAWVIKLLLEGYEDKWTSPKDVERLQDYARELAPDDDIGQGFIYEARCVANLRIGAVEEVPDLAVNAIRHMRAAGSVPGLNYARFHKGLGEMFKGRLGAAEATLQDAQATAIENFGQESTQTAIIDVIMANVLYYRDELDEARRRVAGSLDFIEDHDAWFDIFVSGYDTASSLAFLDGGLEAAFAVLKRGEETVRRRGLDNLEVFLTGKRLRFLVRAGNISQAAELARSLDFPFRLGAWRDQPQRWRAHHEMGIALAKFHLAQGSPSQAREVIDDLKAAARSGGRWLHWAEASIMEALVARFSGQSDMAFEALVAALDIVMPERASRLFRDEGAAMETLLRQTLRTHRDALVVRSLHHSFLNRLIADFEAERAASGQDGADAVLSPRELEVLTELAQGYSNKQIARALDMTENTVKFHLKNIYAKLGVDKRGLAVVEARNRNLIA